jgi:metal-responsive CopG/Arc/MetJ family transcriptional regulator
MAHIRKNCRNLSTTISLEEELMMQIENYRFDTRKNNRSAAIADLIMKGLKYNELVQKKREKNRLKVSV